MFKNIFWASATVSQPEAFEMPYTPVHKQKTRQRIEEIDNQEGVEGNAYGDDGVKNDRH